MDSVTGAIKSGLASRDPPGILANNKLSNTDAWCRYDPIKCLSQVGIETLFLAVAYSVVLFVLGAPAPKVANLVRFAAVFGVLTFSARMVSDSLSDKMTIAGASALGPKILSTLVPKIVGW